MATITLEQIHEDLMNLKKEVGELKQCFHEDFLELSEETRKDIEQSRQQFREGKFVTEAETKKRLGL